MLSLSAAYLILFGAFTIVGGIIGFVKAKSIPSLVAGGVAGAALIVAAVYVLRPGTGPRVGLALGFVVSAGLAARFIPAFLRTRKVMPAGVMSGGAVLALAILGVTILGA
jgi:uncharacterized membrane protein (UPF0136 family)